MVGSNGGENFAFVSRATVEITQHQRGQAGGAEGSSSSRRAEGNAESLRGPAME